MGGREATGERGNEARLGFHFVALIILSCLGVVPHDTTDRPDDEGGVPPPAVRIAVRSEEHSFAAP